MNRTYNNIYIIITFLCAHTSACWAKDILSAWYGEEVANTHGLHKAARKARDRYDFKVLNQEDVLAMERFFLEQLGFLTKELSKDIPW